MTELSRRKKQKPKKPVIDKEKTKQKLNTGLNAFQRTLAIVGGILGLITASITIYTFMNRNNPSNGNSNPVQTIIRQIQGNPETPSSSSQVETGNTETIPSTSETVTPSESSSQEPTLETNNSATTEVPITNNVEGTGTE